MPKDKVNFIRTTSDKNCYIFFFFFLHGNEEEYGKFRNEVYEHVLKHKEDFKLLFLENIDDDILLNTRIDKYIFKIKENCF